MIETWIVFEEKGFPVELVTDRDIERAVASGRLQPDSLVTTCGLDQRPVSARARDVERLKPFFGLSSDEPQGEAGEPASDSPSETEVEPPEPAPIFAAPRATPRPRGPVGLHARAVNAAGAGRAAEARPAYVDPSSFLACGFAPLGRYADFAGRSSRREFWSFAVVQFVAYVALLTWVAGSADGRAGLLALAVLGLIIPNIAAAVRRMHDHNRSGWFVLTLLIPYVGPLILLVLLCLPGDPGSNRYGPNPERTSAGRPG